MEERENNQYQSAISTFTALIEMAEVAEEIPDDFLHDAYIERAKVHLERSSYSIALKDVQTVLDVREEYVPALSFRGTIQEAKGELDSAMIDYVAAISIQPDYQPALDGMSRVTSSSSSSRSSSSRSSPYAPASIAAANPAPTPATAVPGGLPPFWEEQKTKDGRVFYIDHTTSKKHWRLPPEYRSSSSTPLPPFWEERVTSSGEIFFINHRDKSTTWTDPRLSLPS